jgi:sulfide:quinone oxidoreductase
LSVFRPQIVFGIARWRMPRMPLTVTSMARFEALIVGGGVAALEGAIALSRLAGELIDVTLVAPDQHFVYRAMTVHEPFSDQPMRRYPLAPLANSLGAKLIHDSFAWVDRAERIVHTGTGRELHYDALMIAVGAEARPPYEQAITLGVEAQHELGQLVRDIARGEIARLAFVVPARMAWPLPLYEVALMSAARAAHKSVELEISLITSERRPLEIFGEHASQGVSKLLQGRGIDVIGSAVCEVQGDGEIVVSPARSDRAFKRSGGHPRARHLHMNRIVSLPELYGPHVRGLPGAENGFIPVDTYCRVRGVPRVFAAGDATDFPIKHGGIAAQQAVAAAQSIAALAGANVRPSRFHARLEGLLVTGAEPYHLSAWLTGGQPFGSELTTETTSTPTPKVAARHLVAYLERAAS